MNEQKKEKLNEVVFLDLTNFSNVEINSGIENVSIYLHEALSEKYVVQCIKFENGQFVPFDIERKFSGKHSPNIVSEINFFKLVKEIITYLFPKRLSFVLGKIKYLIDNKSKNDFAPQIQFIATSKLFLPEIQLDRSHQSAIRRLVEKNIELIFFVHDLIPLSNTSTTPREISFAFEKYLENVRFASKIYVPSEQVKKLLMGYLQNYKNREQDCPEVYVSSPLGLKKTLFTDSCIHLSLKGKRIIYVSSFIKRKNQIGVIRNVAKFAKRNKVYMHLVLVGAGGNMVNILCCLANIFQNKYLQIVILKDINDCCLSSLYAKTDVAITLSFAEGFGIPVLDALDRNINVISSPIPSAIANEDKENLILVDPSKDSEIQDALNIALNRNRSSAHESQSARISNWPHL